LWKKGGKGMSEYKRLTERYIDEIEVKACMTCETPTCDGCGMKKEILNRLAELETKIEAGKLVELPCKVGDIVYRVRAYHKKKYEIIERICFSITYRGNNSWEIFSTTDDMLGVSVFLTREAAEARLKELEGKGK
jgi:hypothetical protein